MPKKSFLFLLKSHRILNFSDARESYSCMETEIQQAELQDMLKDPSQREKGFRLLMKQYGETLYWHIRRIVVGHDDAEDVLQETCIKIFSSIDSFRGDGKLSTWMTGVRNISCSGASPMVICFLSLSSMKCFNSSSETPINCMFLAFFQRTYDAR